MPKRPSHYYRPDNLDEALRLLARPDTVPLAGGTKLLTGDVDGAVVDLQDLGLNRLDWTGAEWQVGATMVLADLAAKLTEQEASEGLAAMLVGAIRLAGPNTYRHAATLGGTISSRLPDSELLAALLVLEATLELQGGETMKLADYLASEKRPSGLITTITIPGSTGTGRSERVARTPADYPIVSVTLWGPGGGGPRLAATGIGERPFRLYEAESILAGGLNETNVAAAAQAVRAACHHPGDFRGDAGYRAEMAAVLTRRVCG